MIANFNFRIFIIYFFTRVNCVFDFTSTGFTLIALYVLLYLLAISSNLSICDALRHLVSVTIWRLYDAR